MTEESQFPLVTFALFAYNQEQYIREAVEAALAQDYPNLEIVISDDASSDGTWEIIESLGSGYRGSHAIKLNKNQQNLGVTSHVNKVFSLSNGRLLVMAAGDDISAADRVSCLVEKWREKGFCIGLLHSAAQPIDEQGREIFQPMRGLASELEAMTLRYFRENRHRMLIHGATAAYTRELFEAYGPLKDGGLVEDAVMTFRAVLSGRLLFVEEPLVRYRISTTSISGAAYSVREPSKWLRWMAAQETKVRNHIADYQNDGAHPELEVIPEFLRDLEATADGFAAAKEMVAPSWLRRMVGVARHPGLKSLRTKLSFARRFYA